MYEDFFPARLAQLRQAKGVSARDMSLSIGQNKNYINHVENKKMFPSISVFFYICEYLGITPKDFFDDENDNPELINRFTNVLKNLDESDINQLLGIAEKLADKRRA